MHPSLGTLVILIIKTYGQYSLRLCYFFLIPERVVLPTYPRARVKVDRVGEQDEREGE